MKKLIITTIASLFVLLSVSEKADAQFGLGASFEIRDEYPTNGFGFRVEKGILSGIPVIDLDLRAHFSYFNENNDLSLDEGISISRDMDVYDYGLAAVVGVSVGVVRPFAGLGVGRERFKQSTVEEMLSFKENNFYWNAFGGAEFDLLPYLKPFIEYRISRLTSTDDVDFDNVGRLAIGINLRF